MESSNDQQSDLCVWCGNHATVPIGGLIGGWVLVVLLERHKVLASEHSRICEVCLNKAFTEINQLIREAPAIKY